MNKTIKINLTGFAYNLDEDAYNLLDEYINELKVRLGSDAEAEETLKDIEERISELLATKRGTQEVVSLKMVEEVISQLGKPEEITGNHANYSKSTDQNRQHKRLYRNPENSMIAGVCSGLAEYFAVDPIVIRLLFIILIFLKGFGLLLYLILWIATPRALTPKQKLEMRGEPVNLSNIEKTVAEEMNMVRNNLRKSDPKNFLEKMVNFIGQLAYWFLRALLIFIKVIAIIIGIILISVMLFVFIVLVSILFLGGMGFSTFIPEIHGFSVNEFITSMFEISSGSWVTIPIFLIIAIPVVALIYAGVRVIFRFKAKDGLIGLIASGVWVAAVLTLAITIFFQARSLTIREDAYTNITLNENTAAKSNKLYIKSVKYDADSLQQNADSRYTFFDYTLTVSHGVKSITGKPNLIIEKTDESMPNLTLIKNARGGNKTGAKQNASEIIYKYTLTDSLLVLDPVFTLPTDTKWKGQELTVKIYIPEGYTIYLDSTLNDMLDTNQPQCNYWPDEMVGNSWTMTKNGLRKAVE